MLSATNLHWSFSSPSPPQLLVRGTFLFSLPSFTPSSTSPVANTSPLSFLHSASTLTHIPAPKEITTFRHTRPFSSISPVPSLYRNLLTAKSSRASKLQVSRGLAACVRYKKYLIRLLSFYLGVLRWQWSWSPGSTALPSCSYQWLEDPQVELTSLQLSGQGLKAIHYVHWVLTKCQERSSKLIWERVRLCRSWDNEWDLSEADVFLTTLSSWNCILDKIQTYHGNTSIFRKWHCKRNIELKHFSEIKTFEWGKLAS